MNLHRALHARRRGERGAALPMALGFLVLFSVLLGVVFDSIHTGMASNATLENERDDLYGVSGAIDAAINRVRSDDALGRTGPGAPPCDMQDIPVNDAQVDVACEPETGSGEAIPTTAAPPFAILTMSPYSTQWDATYTGSGSYPGCSTISTQTGAELGVIQVQDSKLLTVTGNVYVNSDVDSDTWSGGCPNVFAALGIHVNGDVKVREGCNDMYPVDVAYTWLCADNAVHTPAQAPRQTNGPAVASDPSFEDPAIANPHSWALPFTTPPAVRTVPACPSGNVVAFEPGTYRDAVALSTLMNGTTCPGRVFWFKPGAYYFDFDNAGSHEWSINDAAAKVIAGQPTAVTSGGDSVGPRRWAPISSSSVGFSPSANAMQIDGTTANVQLGNITTGPNAWSATGASSATFSSPENATSINGSTANAALTPTAGSGTLVASGSATTSAPGFSNTGNAVAIGGGTSASGTLTNGQNRWLTLGGYSTNQIPVGATNVQVQARVAHQDSTTSTQLAVLRVDIRNAADSATLCSANLTRGTSLHTDVVPSTAWTAATCPGLDAAALNSGAYRVRYYIERSGSGTTSVSTALDGIELLVSYTVAGASNGSLSLTGFSGPGTIPAAATINSIVMSAAHSEGTTSSGVINAPTVTFPGCTQTLTRRATLTTDTATLPGGCLSVAQLNGSPSITYNVSLAGSTAANVSLDGISLAVTYTVNGTSGTATVTLTGYATSPATSIPDDATITSVRLRVAHAEDNPSLVGNPSVVITPANSAACPAVQINKRATLGEDLAPSYDVTSCFSLPAQLNAGADLQYRIAHCTGSSGGCTTAGTIARLDGIWLDVTYISNPRLPWDPNNPNANPNVPGACRHDGDAFWSDGVQFVFGGDSRINLRSGQVELCNKPSLRNADPSLDQQEIVLFGVKPALSGTALGWAAGTASPTVGGTCPTTLTAPNTSSTFCQSASALALGGSTARALFATPTTTSRTITLAGGWSGTALPSGTTVTSVTARVAHRETNAGIAVTVSGSAGPGCTIGQTAVQPNVNGSVGSGTLQTHFVSLPSCVNANLASLSLDFNANYTCAASCPLVSAPAASFLDGIVLDVTYGGSSSAGGLTPQAGCITQKPYYNPTDHSPNFDNDGGGPNPAACALIKITRPPLSQTPPPGDIRKLTLWGTAYAPAAAFDLPVDILPVPVFNRGVVARMLMLGYQIENSTQVPFTTVPLTGSSPTNRTATFTATIPGKSTRVTADVEFCDNGCQVAGGTPIPPPTAGTPVAVIVKSWKVVR